MPHPRHGSMSFKRIFYGNMAYKLKVIVSKLKHIDATSKTWEYEF